MARTSSFQPTMSLRAHRSSRCRPNTNYVVRIVRTKKEPVATEETYRLLIDELPGPVTERRATVNMVLRYSIPVFFTAPGAVAAKLKWELQRRNNKQFLVATNDGDRRVRIARPESHGCERRNSVFRRWPQRLRARTFQSRFGQYRPMPKDLVRVGWPRFPRRAMSGRSTSSHNLRRIAGAGTSFEYLSPCIRTSASDFSTRRRCLR